MSARILSGRPVAAALQARLAADVEELNRRGEHRQLVIVTATEDPSSASYVRTLQRFGAKIGVTVTVADLGPAASADRIRSTLQAAGANEDVHGIMLQTPLPEGTALADLGGAIAIGKDVDGANPASLARLLAGDPCFAPATAAAVVELLDHYGIGLAGRQVAVVGRSLVVGKPLLHLLLNRDATVTAAHSKTADLAAATRSAEVVVAAAGRAGLIGPAHVAPGSVVIDVGTNFDTAGELVGDVQADAVGTVAAALSPVPGGVGAVTTALLFRNTVYGLPHASGTQALPAAAGAAR
ncbi:bifunctional 5,10-methylenetetrahydrofolate dehydrogenase/5,10-methenyltetrahydrofolate cyclohydrolase [Arthrobacter sp. GCM10027362]|uniref:bifunctional 5,10-methylenetetrahydrofolate dehydrogenase/5,10-methenyltetrahydrofolate cyclohydrolase n=1 Tax=Arthrobacter sp. GCM10027362 TaxID=3273379 RepID=UPI00363949E2